MTSFFLMQWLNPHASATCSLSLFPASTSILLAPRTTQPTSTSPTTLSTLTNAPVRSRPPATISAKIWRSPFWGTFSFLIVTTSNPFRKGAKISGDLGPATRVTGLGDY